jgi:hypothetical protein
MPYKEAHACCTCFVCNGKTVTAKTVRLHADHRRATEVYLSTVDVFPIDIQEGRQEDLYGVRDGLRYISRDTLQLLDSYDKYFAHEDELDEPLWDNDTTAPTLGLMITMHLDWISTFRTPDVSAGHVWAIIRSLIHRNGDETEHAVKDTTYARILKFVKQHKLETVEKIPICPCGLVIYYDFENYQLQQIYQFSSTTRLGCALCGLSKYVPLTTVPRKVVYYISPEIWARDLFQRADLAQYLHNDTDPAQFSTGSVRRSAGYKEKVLDNPRMSEDSRHAPIVGHADGGPYFQEPGTGGAWFFILRHACLPEAIHLDQGLAHMTLLIPSEHWEDDLLKDPITGKDSKTGERNGIFRKAIKYNTTHTHLPFPHSSN